MTARMPTPAERRRMDELFAIAFETPLRPAPKEPASDKVRPFAAFTDDGQMTSCLTVTEMDVNYDGARCKMGAVGGVASLPQYRRQGGVRQCFAAALEDMYARGYEFSYLFPFSTAFYQKFGYERCVQKYGWTVETSRLGPLGGGTIRLAEPSRPMWDAIRTIESAWARRFNFSVLHSPEEYRRAPAPAPAEKQEFTYVYFDAQDRPAAYTTFHKEDTPGGRDLVCSRFFFLDRDGFEGLLGLFGKLASDHRYVKFDTPALPALQYVLPEWNMGAARWEVLHNAGMVRAVCVKSVLEKALYRGAGAVTLAICDEQLPSNSGTYRVRFDAGRAIAVEKTAAEADANLTIGAFSALMAGVCDLSDAVSWLPGLTVRAPSAPLEQVFFRKPLMISDYF